MRLEDPQQHWKKGEKENIWTSYQGCRIISTETSGVDHGAFFEQHPEFDVIIFYAYDGTKKIELQNGGNTKPKVMKEF